jgi:two-component system, LytTR family, sensor kinase
MIKPKHIFFVFVPFFTILTATGSEYYYKGTLLQLIAWVFTLFLQWVLVLFFGHKIINHSQNKFPKINQLGKRILYSIFYMTCSSCIIMFLADFLGDWFIFSHLRTNIYDFLWDIVGAVLITIIVVPVFEMLFSEKVSQRVILENEELIRRNIQGQYDSLKGQVNPHFLFNSLNSLTGLIKKDSEKAIDFVHDLAYVYRYLLKSNEYNLIEISDEIKFAESYFQLIQTRFGENIFMKVNVDEYVLNCKIAPLTFQLLIENAVKHNIISPTKPLYIDVYSEDNFIVVCNNLQKKIYTISSTKTGLANIIGKYKLLINEEIEIIEDETTFKVKIPIIK